MIQAGTGEGRVRVGIPGRGKRGASKKKLAHVDQLRRRRSKVRGETVGGRVGVQ